VAIRDLVGIAFPKDLSEFASDTTLLRLVKRIEHDVEIREDLRECITAIEGMEILLSQEQSLWKSFGFNGYRTICDATVAHAVHLYAKAFNGSNRRRRLDPKKYFNSAPPLVISAHKFFEDLRNQFFAHAELRLNEHTLYVLPGKDAELPTINPSGQVSRTMFAKSYVWANLKTAAKYLEVTLSKEIDDNSRKLESKLSSIQISKINALRRF
jgi:hypothetical protein